MKLQAQITIDREDKTRWLVIESDESDTKDSIMKKKSLFIASVFVCGLIAPYHIAVVRRVSRDSSVNYRICNRLRSDAEKTMFTAVYPQR